MIHCVAVNEDHNLCSVKNDFIDFFQMSSVVNIIKLKGKLMALMFSTTQSPHQKLRSILWTSKWSEMIFFRATTDVLGSRLTPLFKEKTLCLKDYTKV